MSEFFFMSDAEAPEPRDAEAPEQPRVRSIYERTRGRRFMRPIHTLVSVPLWASAPKARLLVVHAAFAAYWGFVNSAMALCLLEHYRQAMIVNARPGARQRQRRLSAVAPVVAAMEELPSSDGQATRGVSSLRSEAP